MSRKRSQTKGIAARAGHWSATNRKKAIGIWIAFVVVALIGGGAVGQRSLTDAESGVGESKAAEMTLDKQGPKDPATESVLVQSKSETTSGPQFRSALESVHDALSSSGQFASIGAPKPSADGHAALIDADLKGDPDDAKDTAAKTFAAVDQAKRANPGFQIGVAGDGTADKQLSDSISDDFAKAETLSIPITLLILVIAFGALVAAGIPLILALSAVMATIGLVSIPSQIFPVDDAIGSVILLIGMAVGVDYSLFYLRREREERARGRSPRDAIDAAAATSGRAVLISGLTVIAAMAGMALSGSSVFISFGIGTLLVVAVAMLGSLTFLPALMSLLGDKMEKGRMPFLSRRQRQAGESRVWSAIVRSVMRRPAVAILVAGGALVALALPAFGMNVKTTGLEEFPKGLSTIQTYKKIQQIYPSEHPPADLVVQADDVRSPAVTAAIDEVSSRARSEGLALAAPEVQVNHDATVASVSLPMAGDGENARSMHALSELRDQLIPASFAGTGAQVDVGGDIAGERRLAGLDEVAPAARLRVRADAVVPAPAVHVQVGRHSGHLDSAESAVGGGGLRDPGARLPARVRSGPVRLTQRWSDQLAAAVPVRGLVRPLDGLPRVHPQPDQGAGGPRHADGAGHRARHRLDRGHGDERGHCHGGGVLDLRHAQLHRLQADGSRAWRRRS